MLRCFAFLLLAAPRRTLVAKMNQAQTLAQMDEFIMTADVLSEADVAALKAYYE